MKRRQFITNLSLGASLGLVPGAAALAAARRAELTEVRSVQALPSDITRTWLGESFWANRLQDWRLRDGRIECLEGGKDFEVRTVSLLTRELVSAHQPGRIRVRVANLAPGTEGFCGFLLGAGQGRLDYRASALVQRASGTGGGFMAVINARGEPGFLDFNGTEQPMRYARIERVKSEFNDAALGGREVILDCHIDPVADGRFDIRLVVTDADSGQERGFAVRTGVEPGELLGGILLVSSPDSADAGSHWSFADLATGGGKIAEHPVRALGPVMGCMHSLNRNTLKLTAQFMPLSTDNPYRVRLETRRTGSTDWSEGPLATVGTGFVAAFRDDYWDPEYDHDYRLVSADDPQRVLYSGVIRTDPGAGRPLKVALYSCMIPTAKSLDAGKYEKIIPQERLIGRWTPDNLFFPQKELLALSTHHDPDLCLFVGDQYYEGFPTRHARETPAAALDTLYRWYLWYWTFRDLVRDRPSIMIADDHDILQGNIWGEGGKKNTSGKEEDGGYVWDLDVVRMVYHVQNAHNPDAFDPTPAANDIPVTYGAFVYGGTSFAVIEDRKFKSAPDYETNPPDTRGELLGKRQEQFLEAWKDMHPGLPKVVITGTMWGSPQTDEDLEPLLDYDANCYPPDGRRRALERVRAAGSNLVLAGDQHLAVAAIQGIDDFSDGPVCFAGPAVSAFWQRWMEGGGKLPNPRNNDPNTGDFTDPFDNRMRVLAVANPKISHAEFEAGNTAWGKFLADRSLKSEGYGLVRIDHARQQHVIECWEWNTNPVSGDQFPGWPVSVPFTRRSEPGTASN